jgi:hypothetical protein
MGCLGTLANRHVGDWYIGRLVNWEIGECRPRIENANTRMSVLQKGEEKKAPNSPSSKSGFLNIIASNPHLKAETCTRKTSAASNPCF